HLEGRQQAQGLGDARRLEELVPEEHAVAAQRFERGAVRRIDRHHAVIAHRLLPHAADLRVGGMLEDRFPSRKGPTCNPYEVTTFSSSRCTRRAWRTGSSRAFRACRSSATSWRSSRPAPSWRRRSSRRCRTTSRKTCSSK